MIDSSIYKISKPIVLVGMMGVGKTTYGKKIASILQIPFIDVDQVIENEIGHSISWIFENFGEEKFRKMEQAKIKEVLDENIPIILALGGGAFLNQETRELISNKAFSVWLKSSPEVIYSRVKARKDRPLLENVDDKLVKIKEIIKVREEFYSKADIEFDTDIGSPKDIPYNIINKIKNSLKL